MKKVVIVKADTNDADYITEEHLLDGENDPTGEYEDLIRKVAGVIKTYTQEHKWQHNWPTSEYADGSLQELYAGQLTDDEIAEFQEYVPHGEHGVHTIKSIRIIVISEDDELVDA